MDFTGKVVVVTGASTGIGAAIAKMFAAHDAKLTLVAKDEARLKQVAKACEEAKGIKPLLLGLDLTVNNSCEIVAQTTAEAFGRIDVLVNSAGKLGMKSLFDSDMTGFDDLFAINLRVPYELTQKCLPHLVKTKGRIVNVFGAPIQAQPGFVTWSMIAEALERFTKSSAVELASEGVKMNAVRPGHTNTDILEDLNGDNGVGDTRIKNLSSINIIEPDEVARMVLLAASEMFPNLNAANLVVDGGLSVG